MGLLNSLQPAAGPTILEEIAAGLCLEVDDVVDDGGDAGTWPWGTRKYTCHVRRGPYNQCPTRRVSSCTANAPNRLPARRTRNHVQVQAGSAWWVDATKGSDVTGEGSEASPFQTIQRAVSAVEQVDAGGDGGRVVYLKTNSPHVVNTTIILGPQHSHTTITTAPDQANPGSRAVVSGGVRFVPEWQVHPSNVTKPHVVLWRAGGFPASMAGVLEIFDAASTNRTLVPARYPNADATLVGSTGISLGKPAWWLPEVQFPNATVIANASYSRKASCATFASYSTGVGGPATGYDPPISYWAQLHPCGGGGVTRKLPSGFVFANNAGEHAGISLSSGGPDGYAFVKQTGNWGSWVFAIDRTSQSPNGTHTTVAFGVGGFQEARGGRTGNGVMFLSHRCELLDVANEWCVGKDGSLYLATMNNTAPPKTIIIPAVDEIFRLQGSASRPVNSTHVTNLILRHTAPTYMKPSLVPSGGDYAVRKVGAIHLNGTTNCSVAGNLLDRVGGNAVWLSDYNRYAQVADNHIAHPGENGIGLVGKTTWVDGRDGNQPRFNTVARNTIHHVGLYTKQSCAVFVALACQNNITSNVLFASPRALVNINDGFGGGTTVARNLFFTSVQDSGDHGPFNSWDRQPFLTVVRNGTPSLVPAFNHLVQNFFFGAGSGQNLFAMDTDDGSDMYNMSRNFVYHHQLFKTDVGGHTKHFEYNVHVPNAELEVSRNVPCKRQGSTCTCGAGRSGESPAEDPTDVFVGNQCVGEPTRVDCMIDTRTTAVIHSNTYYWNTTVSFKLAVVSSTPTRTTGTPLLVLSVLLFHRAPRVK